MPCEMWLYRRILRVSWTDHISTENILRCKGKQKEVIITIKVRKLQYFGHIMRHQGRYQLIQYYNTLNTTRKVLGKRGMGRIRVSWSKNLRTRFSMTPNQLFRTAVNKVNIVNMVANFRNRKGL